MTDTHVTIDTATGTLHGTITGLPQALRDLNEAAHAAARAAGKAGCDDAARELRQLATRTDQMVDAIEGQS